MYNGRGNARRKALKVVNKCIENELEKEGMVDVNFAPGACVDDSDESENPISDEESDQDMNIEVNEVDEATGTSVGLFHYFGILKCFGKILDKVWSIVPDRHAFKLQLNVDGLPLCKSTSTQFWPILGMLQGCSKKPLLIELFCGTSNPNSLTEYLHDLVQELQILKSGFLFKYKTFFVNVVSVVCDTPARAFIRGVNSHTGYHGCDKCHQKGVRISNRMTFPEVNARRRQTTDEEHHIHHSPLADVGIDMVACFPYDYMHLVCLGVMRRLLDLWIGTTGPLRCRISSVQASIVSERLIALRNYIPRDFACRPRALAEGCRWKATELRQFL